MCGAKLLFTNAEIVPVGILRHMNNTPRNNIRLEIDELETLVGILNAYLDRQPAVVLDDEKLTKYRIVYDGCCLRNERNATT